MKHEVNEPDTLLTVLQQLHPNSSNATLRKMLTQGRVLVNEAVVHRAKHEVQSGDTVAIIDRQKAEQQTPPPQTTPTVDLDVVFEDDTLLVVNLSLIHISEPTRPY